MHQDDHPHIFSTLQSLHRSVFAAQYAIDLASESAISCYIDDASWAIGVKEEGPTPSATAGSSEEGGCFW